MATSTSVNLIDSTLNDTHISSAIPPHAIAKIYPQVVHAFSQTGIILSPVSETDENGAKYSKLYEAKTDHFADQPQIRTFILYTVELFTDAQKDYKKYYPDPVPSTIVSQISLGYRGAILELVKSLQDAELEDLAMLYSHLDCVWHFCEIMFITSHPELSILPYFMNWMKSNFDTADKILLDLVSDLPNIDEDNVGDLWNVIYTFIFYGRCSEAEKLLEYTNTTGSSVVGEQLFLMSELLKKKPSFDINLTSLSDFNTKWKIWQDECENRVENLAFSGHDELSFIARVISGQDEAFQEAKGRINTWYEYLCLMLNYNYPTTQPGSLKAYAKKAIDDYGDGTIVLTPFDEILMAAMDFDIVTVLKDMMKYWNHPWFALHFADLICTGGIWTSIAEDRIDYKSVGLIRTDLVREYGIDIMQHESVWEVGVKYLQSLPSQIGLPIISELIRRKKPTSDFITNKILGIASRFNFKVEINSICREVALQKYKEGQYQNALLWAIRASDARMTATLVDTLVETGTISIAPALTDLLPNFTSCGNRLVFLQGYFQFNKLMQMEQLGEAMSVFCRLIEMDVIPKYAGPKMIMSLFDIHNYDVQLESRQTTILMQYLHTKITKESLSFEIFQALNQILLSNRALRMLDQFKKSKNELRGQNQSQQQQQQQQQDSMSMSNQPRLQWMMEH